MLTLKKVWQYYKKLNLEAPTPRYLLKKLKYMQMCITALLIIAKKWKQAEGPPSDKWNKQMWYIHAMECYLVKKEWSAGTRYNGDEP